MNTNDYIGRLLSIDLFKGFKGSELYNILEGPDYIIKRYGKGQIVHMQNEVCSSIDIILAGKLSVQKIDENGNILRVAVFSDRDILGANLMFSDMNRYPLTIVSEMSAVILHIYKRLILDLGQKNQRFMSELLREVSNKTRVLTDKIDEISLKTIRQKIVDFLLYESRIQKRSDIELKITKKELAERLGIQRTSLSRELNKMKKDGLIDYNHKVIRIIDLEVK